MTDRGNPDYWASVAERYRPLVEALGLPSPDRDRLRVLAAEVGPHPGALVLALVAEGLARRRRRTPRAVAGFVAVDPLGPRPSWAAARPWAVLRAAEAVRVAEVLRSELGVSWATSARLLAVSARSLRRWRTGSADPGRPRVARPRRAA